MGTDIYPVVQIRKNDDSPWVSIHPCQEPHHRSDEGNGYDELDTILRDRNYALFGVLAGVRCPDIKPISNQRGIPKDFVVPYRVMDGNCWVAPDSFEASNDLDYILGDHNYGWVTLRELIDYDWSATLDKISADYFDTDIVSEAVGDHFCVTFCGWLRDLCPKGWGAVAAHNKRIVFGFDS